MQDCDRLRLRLQGCEAFGGQTPQVGVFLSGGEVRGVHAFLLDAQQHDGVGVGGDGFVEVVEDFYAGFFNPGGGVQWQQGRRRNEDDLRAEGV